MRKIWIFIGIAIVFLLLLWSPGKKESLENEILEEIEDFPDDPPTMNLQSIGEWGRIANRGFEGHKIATTLYFPGVPRNKGIFTAHPLKKEEGFSETDIRRQLRRMKSVGINAVQISFFGKNSAEGSMYLPMDASGRSFDGDVLDDYNLLIETIESENMLFFPLIEVSTAFPFWKEFPNQLDNMNERISWWAANFGESKSWMEAYDRNGRPRKVVSLIESINLGAFDADAYVRGLEDVSDTIKSSFGIDIAFSIDPTRLPPDHGTVFGPKPEHLVESDEVLFILPWDITVDGNSEDEKHASALTILTAWNEGEVDKSTKYPVVAFVIPGYDGSIVFPNNHVYGKTDEWREKQKQLALPTTGTAGISVGPWNGWSEYFHITCSQEEGDKNLKWAKEVIDMNNGKTPNSEKITCP